MILNNGNIRKSKILKGIYGFTDDTEYIQDLEKYLVTLETEFYKPFLEIRNFLHDSKIQIIENNNDVILYVDGWNNDSNESITFNIIFQNAKILSWNCVNKNGHICRLNKKYSPLEYGYEEFYEFNNKKYVSIVCFGEKIKKGIYAPFVNMQFENLIIYRYERSINWFDKKSEKLVGKNKISIDFSKLKKVFFKEMKDDPLLMYEYEINTDQIKKLGIKMDCDDKNFDYILSYNKI